MIYGDFQRGTSTNAMQILQMTLRLECGIPHFRRPGHVRQNAQSMIEIDLAGVQKWAKKRWERPDNAPDVPLQRRSVEIKNAALRRSAKRRGKPGNPRKDAGSADERRYFLTSNSPSITSSSGLAAEAPALASDVVLVAETPRS